MANGHNEEQQGQPFDEELVSTARTADRLALGDLRRVRMNVSAELGSADLLVRDVLELHKGSVIRLNKVAGELADIYINGLPIARGEVVVMMDVLNIRIAEILGVAEKEGGYEE